MNTVAALREGIRRVNRAPAILASLWLVTLLVALPSAIALRGSLEEHFGRSLAAESAATGVNHDWWQQFMDEASGLAATFSPTILGFGAVMENISGLLDGTGPPIAVVGVIGAYLLLWLFVAGGAIDRYARNRPTRTAGFFAASATYGVRFLRLAVMAGLAYYALFAWLHPLLFDTIFPWATRDLTVERTAFALRAFLYLLFGALLVLLTTLFDYAKIRTVVEDRRSMIGAVVAAARFIRRRTRAVVLLYLMNSAIFVMILAAYAFLAPGASPGVSILLALVIGQIYVVTRLWAKLLFYASQTVFFQGSLAHAEYAASPQPVWPESPAAETIGNVGR
jgi:hypothetical protein